ncbi:family 20 glycosylhydrolase [Streptomyces sp. NBC_01498]|uniref:beta-N-acetylhexosaminidase n=1 Tax=Streptomyces sp. NBC_01498 TaxID=2975870 RepID=UPI002E7AD3EA|nr:glycoside hydrolase family 20 protein [Streptomyces sp. NBC_01498]WTL25026.1 family 20 glycosylhydrolase [Streptomyces sp. NBC_01498]
MRWNSPGALAGGAAVVAAAVTLTVVAWPDSTPDHAGPAGTATAPAATSDASSARSDTRPAAPTPSRSFALSEAPRTVPSVREHQAARGPGWRPGGGSAVVVAKNSGQLADEGQLLAKELKIDYRGTAGARAGDVELALESGKQAGPESYTLTARDGRVRIAGPDEAGVFYGTRTLKQSVAADGAMPEGVVQDRPDRPQRGLNLDIARKYYTAGWIEDRLREMADLKLNQLGLHFSDDQGFRIASDTHPEIVSKQHLTKAEVKGIVALAGSLHIDVVPEIDNPGHLGAVLAPHPELQLRNVDGQPTRGAIDISKPASARIVDELLREYDTLFPGSYWHIGGDEYQALVVKDPAASFPQLAAAAQKKYGSGASVQDLATGWTNDRAAVVRPRKKNIQVWNDGVHAGGAVKPDPKLQIDYWTGKEIGARPPLDYLREGRTVVNLNDEFLYYVLGQPNDFVYPTGRRIYEQWTPLVLRGTSPVPRKYSKQILGARFAVWGDIANAQTPAQVASGIRLPLAALSQKVWNPAKPALGWSQFTALVDKVGG